MPITEAAKAHLAKLAERGAQAKPVAKKVEEAPVEAPAADAEEAPAEGE
jgi:hypothetical protein